MEESATDTIGSKEAVPEMFLRSESLLRGSTPPVSADVPASPSVSYDQPTSLSQSFEGLAVSSDYKSTVKRLLWKSSYTSVSSSVKASLKHSQKLAEGEIKDFFVAVGTSTGLSVAVSGVITLYKKSLYALLGVSVVEACILESRSMKKCADVFGNIGGRGVVASLYRPKGYSGAALLGVLLFVSEYAVDYSTALVFEDDVLEEDRTEAV
eukprot:CAMPEP_0174262014 /NCGR_PEP_ID=MMETSP0439-20130205/12725_1 /TAXON_ID=0 /ORGANISM="Stereomyxa ramosa, Strain Chinc5" /LENGTH=209 /DNA_ID=CAMNT_0015346645 /DNA_START=160 /DNA_END=789 /DNA_ORIENTATION=+